MVILVFSIRSIGLDFINPGVDLGVEIIWPGGGDVALTVAMLLFLLKSRLG